MEITLTLARSDGSAPDDIVLTCPPGTPWRDVAEDPLLAGAWWAGPSAIGPGMTVGAPPLVHGAVLADRPLPSPGPGVARLVVASGPDAGHGLTVRPGSTTVVGRDPGNDLVIADPTVSRRHASVHLRHDGVDIQPLTETNADAVPQRDTGGARLQLGSSLLVVRRPQAPVTRPPDGEGRLVVSAAVTRPAPAEEVTVTFPAEPQELPRRPFPLLLLVGPLVASGVVAVVLHSPHALLLGLLSPLMMLFQVVADRRAGRTGSRRAHREYGRASEAAERRLAEAQEAEAARLHAGHPDLAHVVETALQRGASLWTGVPLAVRVGTGDAASRVRLDRGGRDGEAAPDLPCAPVLVDLAPGTTLHVTGPAAGVRRVVDAVLVRLATSCGPDALTVDRTEATAWLPHADGARAPPCTSRCSGRPAPANGPCGGGRTPGTPRPPGSWRSYLARRPSRRRGRRPALSSPTACTRGSWRTWRARWPPATPGVRAPGRCRDGPPWPMAPVTSPPSPMPWRGGRPRLPGCRYRSGARGRATSSWTSPCTAPTPSSAGPQAPASPSSSRPGSPSSPSRTRQTR